MENVELPENRLDDLPTTFSGGEQQRINIACGFIGDYPILLLDEPTASLDTKTDWLSHSSSTMRRTKGVPSSASFTMTIASNAQETANDH